MIIQNGNVVFKDTVEKKDIRIADGKIEKIAEKAAKNRKVFLQSLDSPGENVL